MNPFRVLKQGEKSVFAKTKREPGGVNNVKVPKEFVHQNQKSEYSFNSIFSVLMLNTGE